MGHLFFYGTLCHAPLLSIVLGDAGAANRVKPAELSGWAASWVQDAPFPMIRSQDGASTKGVVLPAVTDAEYERLRYYEGGFDYALQTVDVTTPDGTLSAEIFVPAQGRWSPGAAWDLAEWEARYGDLTLEAAGEVMERYGITPVNQIDDLFPWIRARAWARLLGRDAAPCHVRRKPAGDDVKVEAERTGFEGFFRMKPFDVSHRKFDGQRSDTIQREVFMAFDAALVLPYDPQTDQVLLVEQMRFGPIWRKDPAPWVLEPIAGLVDAGEYPADCARREAREEAGLALGDLMPMAKVYPSPGYSTEFFHCFLGLCDLSDHVGGVAGLDAENEDIRSHILSFDDAMALVDSGEINAAPLAMMLLWLARRRDEVRSKTGGARP